MLNFYQRLFNFGTITLYDVSIARGKYFDYPDCCIKWYSIMSNQMFCIGDYTEQKYKTNKVKLLYDRTIQYLYVRCPACKDYITSGPYRILEKK